MKHLIKFLLTLIIIFLTACNHDDSDEVGKSEILRIKVSVSNDYIGYTLTTPFEEILIENNSPEILSCVNSKVQTFVVNDGESVFLMSRTPVKRGSQIVLDAQSTTLALVTMYPLFSPIEANDYNDIVSLITSSEKYPALFSAVSKAVAEKQNIYDVENDELLKAFSNLIEDIFGDIEEEVYSDTLVVIENHDLYLTRAEYESARLDPTYIDADLTGNKLTLRSVGLTPTYFGTVTYAEKETENLVIWSRKDFGGLDLFTRTVGNWRYGKPMEFKLSKDGEYYFNFSRTTPEAIADFFLRIANSIISALGLELGEGAILEIGNCISRAMINAGSGVSDQVIDPMEWVGIAYKATLDQLKNGSILGFDVSDSFFYGAKFLAGSLNFYNRIKGIGNTAARVAYGITAPNTFSFCLCNYHNDVTTCTEASIEKISGDNQTGYAKQRLLEPLCVYVETIDENGVYVESRNYHRVKYEVTKGGGKVSSSSVSVNADNIASVDWILGTDGDQEVRAVVIDIITGNEISESIYFSATLEKAEITVRLDWSQHSGNTDIDLHVVDPFGERIYFGNMISESGGYLDRDDTHGPGPEHIHWNSAPSGPYKVYVHYYPNEDEDKSVVSYKVSVTADGVTYRPVTGSISYNQMIPVGQFTIGNASRASTTLDPTDRTETFSVPQKK